jgi:hypothetical protein
MSNEELTRLALSLRTSSTQRRRRIDGHPMSEANKALQPKRIILITTEHLIQRRDYSDQGEFRNIILYLVATFSPQIILEEWREGSSLTVGRRIANDKLPGAWYNISPPPKLNLTWRGYRNLDGLMLQEYGPISLQTAREQYMLDRILNLTNQSETALVIAGLAHHQSLSEKLLSLQYEVQSFCFVIPGDPIDPIKDSVSSDWKWLS